MIESGTIQSVVDTTSKVAPVLLGLLIFLIALLVQYRTGSTHILFRWIWRRLAGSAKGNDTAFNEFMGAQDNLMQFRLIAGKVRTVAQMHSLIKWGRDHNEDIGSIKACGPNFDRELPGLKAANKRPTRNAAFWLSFAATGVAGLLLVTLVFATLPGALLTVKDTKTWLIVDEQSARSLRHPDTKRLARDQCSQPNEEKVARSGLSARDVSVICELYAHPELSKDIARTIREQRAVFGPFAGMLLCLVLAMWRSITQANAALAMASRLAGAT